MDNWYVRLFFSILHVEIDINRGSYFNGLNDTSALIEHGGYVSQIACEEDIKVLVLRLFQMSSVVIDAAVR